MQGDDGIGDDLGHTRLKPPLSDSATPRDGEPAGIEKIKQWQQERIERRLRGEYESAVIQLNHILAENFTTPLRISSIRVQGAPNTRSSFLSSILTPHLAKSSPSSTLQSVLHQVKELSDTLNRTDIFAVIEPTLDNSWDPLSQTGDVDILFKCREKKRFFLKSATEIGNGEGTASLTGRARNVFGGAEVLEGTVSLGMKTRRAFNISLRAPLTGSLNTHGEVAAFATEKDNSTWASSREVLQGIRAAVRTHSVLGTHEVAYEATLRHVTSLSPSASLPVRRAAGHSIKSAISHALVYDTRGDPHTSTSGIFVRASQELAGLGGDAAFVKAEAESKISRWLTSNLALSFAARSGLLLPLDLKASGNPSIYFSDRFHLGGPLNIRMFKTNSLGPRVGTDSLGGDMYWAAGLSLIGKFPWKEHWPLRTHLFVNAGRLEAMNPSMSLTESAKASLRYPSVSVGVGLIYRFDTVRLELNFGVPLAASKSDGFQRGFQAGIGLEFL